MLPVLKQPWGSGSGFIASGPRKPVYSLDVPARKSGAQVSLRAQVADAGGADYTDNVFWDLNPADK